MLNTALEDRVQFNCHVFSLCLLCVHCIYCPPLYSLVDPDTTTAHVVVFDDYVDDRTPTIELPGKQCPFTSPTYTLLVYILSVALGIYAATLLTYSNA